MTDEYGYLKIEYDIDVSNKIGKYPEFKKFMANLGKRTAEKIVKESFKYPDVVK